MTSETNNWKTISLMILFGLKVKEKRSLLYTTNPSVESSAGMSYIKEFVRAMLMPSPQVVGVQPPFSSWSRWHLQT